jgi:hypothetical protein
MTSTSSQPIVLAPSISEGVAFDGDLFDRFSLAQRLTSTFSRFPDGGVIEIDSRWGTGKTWFAVNWKQYLSTQGFKTAYVDCFDSDYFDDPFIMLAAAFSSVLSEGGPKRAFSEKAKKIALALIPGAAKTILGVAGKHILGEGASETLKETAESFGEALAEKAEKYFEEKIEQSENYKRDVSSFKELLENATSSSDTNQTEDSSPKKPIIIFVDELDRCKPDFALKTIERMKHFFDTKNVIFILLVNKDQIITSVKKEYGMTNEQASEYLSKFIHIAIKLPPISSHAFSGKTGLPGDQKPSNIFISSTLARYGFNATLIPKFISQFSTLADAADLSLREIERGIMDLALLQGGLQPGSSLDGQYLAWPIFVKLTNPSLFSSIASSPNIEANLLAARYSRKLSLMAQKKGLNDSLFSQLKAMHAIAYGAVETPGDDGVCIFQITDQNIPKTKGYFPQFGLDGTCVDPGTEAGAGEIFKLFGRANFLLGISH